MKVFKVDTETDLLFLGEVAARQLDSDHLRTWEVAGASHVSFSDHARRVGLVARDSLPPYTPWICDVQPALSHVATFQVLNAVYGHISRWISRGTPPPTAPRVDVLSGGPPVVLNRTSLGLATGGIQLSQQACQPQWRTPSTPVRASASSTGPIRPSMRRRWRNST